MVFSSLLFPCSKHFSISYSISLLLKKTTLLFLLPFSERGSQVHCFPASHCPETIQPLQLTTCLIPTSVDSKQKFILLLFLSPLCKECFFPWVIWQEQQPIPKTVIFLPVIQTSEILVKYLLCSSKTHGERFPLLGNAMITIQKSLNCLTNNLLIP